MLNFFLKKKPKYEFYLYKGNQKMVDDATIILQNEGWELAGSITPFLGHGNYQGMLIPFKRKIN